MLLACVVMTAGLLFYVFSPPARLEQAPEKTRLAFLRERKDVIYENLRDLNFEHKAGKVPESDYLSLRTSLEDEAAALLAEIDLLENPRPSNPKESRFEVV
jgi:hypothetical protein